VRTPAQVLEEGRKPARRWAQKLPTVMASGPDSWNMQACVVEETESGPVFGPLRMTEAERCMGMRTNATRVREEARDQLSE